MFLLLAAPWARAEEFPVVDSLAELEAFVDDTWNNHPMPKVSPPDTPCFLDLGPVVFSDTFPAAFLDSLVAVTNGAVVLRPLLVTETNLPPRQRLYFNAAALPVHTTTTFGVGYPQSWIVGAYGAPPGYLSGAALAAWYAERDPIRVELSMALLSTSAVPVYLQQMSNDVPTVGGTNLLAVYSNEIAFVSFRRSAGLRRMLLHAPMNIALLDLFRAPALPPEGAWTHLAVLGHSSDPVPYTDGSALSNAFFALANALHDGDGDGLASGRELLLYGTSATTNDTDGDGLTDSIEVLTHGTNPNHADTDGDGLPDGWEVAHGVPPGAFSAYWDSDLDGLSDLQEFLLETDPRSNDSDSDRIPDRWEVIHGLDPRTPDAEADPNQNSVSNWEEYLNSTDPRAYASSVGLVSVAGNFNGWNTQANPMRRVGPHRWRAVIELPAGVAEFKFVGEARWDSGVLWGGPVAVTSAVPIVTAPLVLVTEQYNLAANVVAGGLYQFDLDEAQDRFSLTAVAQADFSTAEPPRYRLVGTFNQWDLTDEPMQMTPVGDGWYHLRVSDFWEAVTELKIVEGDTWLINWGAPSAATYGPEGVLSMVPAGPDLRLATATPSAVYHFAFHPASGALDVRVAGVDADQDGLLAAEESYLGASDTAIDSDQDGWDDAPERVSDSDPADPQSAPSTATYLPVEVRIQDADQRDDVWEVRVNGRRVAKNPPRAVASTTLALPYGEVAKFTLRRIGAGQWTVTDEYEIDFTLAGQPGVSPCWEEGEGNSPRTGSLDYTGPNQDIPPRTSHLRWVFEPRKVAIEQAEYVVCWGDTAATEIRLTADSYDAPGYVWSSEPPEISGSGRVLSVVPANLPAPGSYTLRVASADPHDSCSAESRLGVVHIDIEQTEVIACVGSASAGEVTLNLASSSHLAGGGVEWQGGPESAGLGTGNPLVLDVSNWSPGTYTLTAKSDLRHDCSDICEVSVVKIESETVATTPADPSRTTLGIGEAVQLTLLNAPSDVTWTATGGGTLSMDEGPTTRLTVPLTAGSVTAEASYQGGSCGLTFTVVEPIGQSYGEDIAWGTGYPKMPAPPAVYIGNSRVFSATIEPTTVSFENVDFRENMDFIGFFWPSGEPLTFVPSIVPFGVLPGSANTGSDEITASNKGHDPYNNLLGSSGYSDFAFTRPVPLEYFNGVDWVGFASGDDHYHSRHYSASGGCSITAAGMTTHTSAPAGPWAGSQEVEE